MKGNEARRKHGKIKEGMNIKEKKKVPKSFAAEYTE
jgi:hypothetical protein